MQCSMDLGCSVVVDSWGRVAVWILASQTCMTLSPIVARCNLRLFLDGWNLGLYVDP